MRLGLLQAIIRYVQWLWHNHVAGSRLPHETVSNQLLSTRTQRVQIPQASEVARTTDPSGARGLPRPEDELVVAVPLAESVESRLDEEEDPTTAADLGRHDGFAALALAASAIIIFSMSSPFVPFRGVR